MWRNSLRITVFLLLSHVAKCQLGVDCYHSKLKGPGVCVAIKYCESAIKELQSNLIPQTCRIEDNYPIVCCPLPKPANQPNKPSIAEEKCKEYKRKYEKLIIDNRKKTIVGGTNATIGEFPHMAALGYGNATDIHWLCGGSLISERFILTAAHCMGNRDFGQVKYVQMGDIQLSGFSTTSKIYQVFKRHVHPNFQPPVTYHDIALLELNKPADISGYIKPACLLTKPSGQALNNIKMKATGWGLLEYGGAQSNILQKVELDRFDKCQEKYKPGRRLTTGILDDIQICYGSEKDAKDACSGDSGGPLQYPDYALFMYRIIGVTSFGNGCGTPGLPGVYTRVSHYVPWIESIVWP